MFSLNAVASQIWSDIVRVITGRLFTPGQISKITSHAVGQHFSDLFPEPERDKNVRARIEQAQGHIVKAGSVISSMQAELESQSTQLEELVRDIEDKKELALKYQTLADTNEEKFSAFKEEMGQALRLELEQQSEEGRLLRRISSIFIWIVTLLLGAALGSYFKEIVNWFSTLVV